MDYSNLFVCLMGLGTVFVGLVCIILLVTLMSYVCRKSEGKSAPAPAPAPVSAGRSRMSRTAFLKSWPSAPGWRSAWRSA